MTTTLAKGLNQPTIGGDNNTWGNLLNTNMSLIDSALGGTLALSISGNTTLSSSQAQNTGYEFSGTLSGIATITWPAFSGIAVIQNGTIGGFSIICKMAGGAAVTVLSGETAAIWSDGTNFARLAQVGGGLGSTGSGAVVLATNPSISMTATGGNSSATLASRLGHNLNVIDDFGAKGDGTTDDQPALAAASTGIGVGGSVFVPNTNSPYMIGTTGIDQIVAGQTWFFAPGAMIKKKLVAGPDVDATALKLDAANLSVFNGTFDGNTSGGVTSPPLYVTSNGTGAHLSNITIQNSGQWGFYAEDVSNLTVDGLKVSNVTMQEPVFIQAAHTAQSNISLRHIFVDQSMLSTSWAAPCVYFDASTTTGVNIDQRVTIDDVIAIMPANPMHSDPAAVVLFYVNNATVSNVVSTGGAMGVSTAGCSNSTFTNISANGFTFYGLEVAGAVSSTFSNLSLLGNGCYYGIAVQGRSPTITDLTDNTGHTTVGVSDATGIVAGEPIVIFLDNHQLFTTTVNGNPTGLNVTLTNALPSRASAGARITVDLVRRSTFSNFTIGGLGNLAAASSAGIYLESDDSVVVGPGYINAMAPSAYRGNLYGIWSSGQNNIAINSVSIEGDDGSGGTRPSALIESDFCTNVQIIGGRLSNSGGYAINIVSYPPDGPVPDNILISGVSGTGHTSGFINLLSVSGGTFGSNIRVVDCEAFTVAGFRANALDLANNIFEVWGTGSPNSVVTANIGSIFHQTNGTAGNTFWIKDTGTGNTGWVPDSMTIAGHTVALGGTQTLATTDLSDFVTTASWTPVLNLGGGTTGITYSAQTGRYVRVGKFVIAVGTIILSNKGSATGAATITGLPVAVNSNNIGSVEFPYRTGMSSSTGAVKGAVNSGTTITIYEDLVGVNITAMDDTYFTNSSHIEFTATYISV